MLSFQANRDSVRPHLLSTQVDTEGSAKHEWCFISLHH